MASIPGPVDGLTSIASDSVPLVMKLAKEMQQRESSMSKVERALVLLDEAEENEPNPKLRNRILMSSSLLREGPKDS